MMNKLFFKIQIFIAILVLFCGCEKVQNDDTLKITKAEIKWVSKITHNFHITLQGEIKDTTFKCGVFISEAELPDKDNYKFCFYVDSIPPHELGNPIDCFTKKIDINSYKSPNTTLYWRAFIRIKISGSEEFTYYSETGNFDIPDFPDVTTYKVVNITCGAATLQGEVTGVNVTDKGFSWYSDDSETFYQSCEEQQGDYFTLDIDDLSSSTLYYVRAYATQLEDTIWGDIRDFTTAAPFAVETTGVYDITPASATCSGEVTGDCGFPVFMGGFCWSESPNPTINDDNSGNSCDAGTGVFDYTITELKPNTLYYVRAFAMNTQTRAIEYGEIITFTTGE